MKINRRQQRLLMEQIVSIQYELGIITEEISSERAVKAMGQVLKDLSILNGEISRSTIEEIKEVTF